MRLLRSLVTSSLVLSISERNPSSLSGALETSGVPNNSPCSWPSKRVGIPAAGAAIGSVGSVDSAGSVGVVAEGPRRPAKASNSPCTIAPAPAPIRPSSPVPFRSSASSLYPRSIRF